MKYFILFCLLLIPVLGSSQNNTQETYKIDLRVPEKEIYSKHLELGGSNSDGTKYEVNNYYISKNGKPIIPITGEFHFSRFPEAYWEEAIQKMKAGGINMIATYVFWNMHEEIEGEFIWEGNRDVRKFIELCAQYDMPVILRIGPFGHGEIRNGALPDWLLAKPITIRSNDPQYLFYAERLYNEIGKQVKGLLFKDGGPIIATQLENEYQASAAPWGLTYPGQPLDYTSAERDKAVTLNGVGIATVDNPYADLGTEHMRVLKSFAQKAGIITPLYTATGWSRGAIIPNETLPVTAAYPYPTWTKSPDLSPFYLYSDMHKTPDYSPVNYTVSDYPAFAAELGGGIMATYTRRPLVPAKSLDALINRCLGSGANGIGYYMYHGGSTPRGKTNFFSDEAFGSPKISYDFQAPIGEFGEVRASFHRLKLLHDFINTFSEELAPMQTVLPENHTTITPDNASDLRYAVRFKDESGFLFLNNFQDDADMNPQKNVQVDLQFNKETLHIPEQGGFDLETDENLIFPFNFKMKGLNLNYATAQLMTRFENEGTDYYVFFTPQGTAAEFSFEADQSFKIIKDRSIAVEKNSKRWLIRPKSTGVAQFTFQKGKDRITVLVLPKEKALNSWLYKEGNSSRLLVTDAVVLETGKSLKLLSKGSNKFEFELFPKIIQKPGVNYGSVKKLRSNTLFSSFEIQLPEQKLDFSSEQFSERRLVIDFKGGIPKELNNVFMKLDYEADTAMGFYDNELVVDQLYLGIPWEIGLRELINLKGAQEMNFYFRPIQKNAPYLIDLKSTSGYSGNTGKVVVNSVEFIPEYTVQLDFE